MVDDHFKEKIDRAIDAGAWTSPQVVLDAANMIRQAMSAHEVSTIEAITKLVDLLRELHRSELPNGWIIGVCAAFSAIAIAYCIEDYERERRTSGDEGAAAAPGLPLFEKSYAILLGERLRAACEAYREAEQLERGEILRH